FPLLTNTRLTMTTPCNCGMCDNYRFFQDQNDDSSTNSSSSSRKSTRDPDTRPISVRTMGTLASVCLRRSDEQLERSMKLFAAWTKEEEVVVVPGT
ncbi:hypothetical protein PMAYCL1PPCAC_28789, partial [Pristionchus mayeri]